MVWDKVSKALPGQERLTNGIAAERNWRYGYDEWMLKVYEAQVLQCAKDERVAMDSLAAGLEAATDLEFERHDGSIVTLKQEIATNVPTLSSVTVTGSGPTQEELVVPYKGQDLSGDALHGQLDAWSDYGCMEPDVASAIKASTSNLSSIQRQSFVEICIKKSCKGLEK